MKKTQYKPVYDPHKNPPFKYVVFFLSFTNIWAALLDGWHDKKNNKLPNSWPIYGKSNPCFPYFFFMWKYNYIALWAQASEYILCIGFVGGRLFQCLLWHFWGVQNDGFTSISAAFFGYMARPKKHQNLKSNCAMYCFPAGFLAFGKNRTRSTGQRIHFMYWSLVGGRFYRWRNPQKKFQKKKVSRWHNSRIWAMFFYPGVAHLTKKFISPSIYLSIYPFIYLSNLI